ncbi:uncharacterized protein TRUGW13939_07790 [Talaromyces rugulosus]|uniref:Beta-lactamase-related domain-containing protein n=1 Tax=Talaromyces rugulosus TaxID=121627 RepID=A0A7H8R2N7_TALRU|nr:uncharacterized protein TRUGW13939_07790 [Talaromyces rugulosus]QKX60644.1 hypothetical protein TRUGW13939_07790 [Talaromyces rugulosus]
MVAPRFRLLPVTTSSSHDIRENINDIIPSIRALREIGGTAGMSVGVIKYGEILLEHHLHFADVESQRVAESTTRYPIGSLSKSFVAATVAQLVHEGQLQWNEPITTYLPELSSIAGPMPADQLTLIDLLSHQTGLPGLDAMWLGANNEINIPKDFTVAMCKHLPALYPNPFQVVVQQLDVRSSCQVGMSQSSVIESEIPAGSTALPYAVLDDKTKWRIGDVRFTDGKFMSPAGGVRNNILFGHSFINKSASFDEMYGLGFAKVTLPAQFGKTGFNPGPSKSYAGD